MIAAAALALSLVQGPRVEGMFVIRVDSEEVARESYTLAPGRLASGQPGWTLAAVTRFDRSRPTHLFAPTVEIGEDSLPMTLQFDVVNSGEPVRVLGQLGRDRYTVRTVAKSFERAREFPIRTPLVVLDDSVMALYQVAAWYAGSQPVTLTAIVPRAPRREQLVITDVGSDSTVVARRATRLRHVTLSGGANGVVHLWVDDRGLLTRLEIPSRRLVAERIPSD